MSNFNDEEHFASIWMGKLHRSEISQEYTPGANLRVDFCLKHLVPGEYHLDIGCGSGVLSACLKNRYLQVYGVDISEIAVNLAKEKQVQAIQRNLNYQTLPFEDQYFDAITVLSTLQYFYDIHFVLSEIRRVIKPGGILIMTIPNMRAFWRIGRLAILGSFPKVSKDQIGYDGGTIHYFCFRDIDHLLRTYGFSVCTSTGIYCIPAIMKKMPDFSILRIIKREFFSAEIALTATKE